MHLSKVYLFLSLMCAKYQTRRATMDSIMKCKLQMHLFVKLNIKNLSRNTRPERPTPNRKPPRPSSSDAHDTRQNSSRRCTGKIWKITTAPSTATSGHPTSARKGVLCEDHWTDSYGESACRYV